MSRQARSLDVLLAEINKKAPQRSKVSDGGLGDPAHAARVSDHNPNKFGVWRARDVTNDPRFMPGYTLSRLLAGRLGKHPALMSGAYIIFNHEIISFDRLKEGWRPYFGANGHEHHVHVSVSTAPSGYDSTKPWNLWSIDYRAGSRDLFLGAQGSDVRFLQKKIHATQDGVFGVKTKTAVLAWEKQHNLSGGKPRLVADGIVGVGTWAALGVTPTYGLGHRDLHKGDEGPDVKFIQAKVGVKADGVFGDATAAAVKKWEQGWNKAGDELTLRADGIVGIGTWTAMGVTPLYKAGK